MALCVLLTNCFFYLDKHLCMMCVFLLARIAVCSCVYKCWSYAGMPKDVLGSFAESCRIWDRSVDPSRGRFWKRKLSSKAGFGSVDTRFLSGLFVLRFASRV